MILDGERRRLRELKETLERELENERKMRVEYENKIIRMKEEAQQRELLISELDFKMNDISNQNASLAVENNTLKQDIMRVQEIYQEKFEEQERKILAAANESEELNSQVQRLRDQHSKELEAMNREWEHRINMAEEKGRVMVLEKQQQEEKIRQFNAMIMKIKMQSEEEVL